MGITAKIAINAIIGGTAEKLGGGKFANGAITGAYVVLFNHLAQHGGGNDPTKDGGGYVNSRKEGLEFIEKEAMNEQVEVSMFETEGGESFVNPWDKNLFDKCIDVFEVKKDGIYIPNTDKKIVKQYHFGPSVLPELSIAGPADMRYAHRHNVTVYHISIKSVYRFSPKEVWYWIDPPKPFSTKKSFYE